MTDARTVSVSPPQDPGHKGKQRNGHGHGPEHVQDAGTARTIRAHAAAQHRSEQQDPRGYSTSLTIEGNARAIAGATFDGSGDIASKGIGGGRISADTEGLTKFVAPRSINVQIEGKN